jgi:ClpX C4-type zinc finger
LTATAPCPEDPAWAFVLFVLLRLDDHDVSSDTRQMGLDKELVREAARAKEELAVAEHAAYRAKVHYHQAIRRVHAAGGSLREIAEAFRMSHQRVHQIINQAAEATRRRESQVLSGPVGPCSFCGRPRDVCAKLIVGPEVFICDRCVMQATRLAAGSVVEGQAEGSMRLELPESQAKCSFCDLEARQVRHLVASGLAVPAGMFGEPPRICDKCRDLGLEILAEPSPP